MRSSAHRLCAESMAWVHDGMGGEFERPRTVQAKETKQRRKKMRDHQRAGRFGFQMQPCLYHMAVMMMQLTYRYVNRWACQSMAWIAER